MELEILDTLLLQLFRRELEARIGTGIVFQILVLDAKFVDKVTAQIAFAHRELAALDEIRIGKLRHTDIGLDTAFLHGVA